MVHVLAVDLGQLAGLQRMAGQGRHGGQQIGHAHLAGAVAHVVRGRLRPTGDGAAGAQDDGARRSSAWHFEKVWIKIQILDATSALLAVGPANMESPKLTARQQQILDLVQSTIERTGAPPTRAEIAAELGFKSPNAAEEHLQALARKGVIELVGGTSRASACRRGLYAPSTRPAASSLPCPCPAWPSSPCRWWGVAAGHPILAQEHIDQTYVLEASSSRASPTTC
jgi:repressor LexA